MLPALSLTVKVAQLGARPAEFRGPPSPIIADTRAAHVTSPPGGPGARGVRVRTRPANHVDANDGLKSQSFVETSGAHVSAHRRLTPTDFVTNFFRSVKCKGSEAQGCHRAVLAG
jgi:hypothetical protein